MPKVTIAFTLPEENSEYRETTKAPKMASIILDFTQLCRNKTKYGDGKAVAWETISEEWWALLKEENYDPYED